MVHKKYPKIHRLGKEETEGILDGEVLVQEKIDGANTSIWLEFENDKDFGVIDSLAFGSRNNQVPDFRGLKTYVEKHLGIQSLLKDYPHYRLFGEWLVKHTVKYNQLSYNHFYLFDIYDHKEEKWLDAKEVKFIAELADIKSPEHFGVGKYTEEQLKDFMGKSVLGERGEGIVIKRENWVNKFGDFQYAKMVTEKFKEDNKIMFGGNDKHSDCYWETYCMNEWITEARVRKIIQKIESQENRKIEIKDTPRVSNTVYHDFIEEEAWTMNKKRMKIDFQVLARMCGKKITMIFKEILEDE